MHGAAVVRAVREVRGRACGATTTEQDPGNSCGYGHCHARAEGRRARGDDCRDGNQFGVVGFAAEQVQSERVEFQVANAQNLPFEDGTFDVVVSLFGIMFFPDKVRANAEALRVLRPQGRYLVVAFDRLDLNPIPRAAGEAVASLFPEDPRYMERGPFSYTDPAVMEQDLRVAGFEPVEAETIALSSRVSARDAAQGIVLGSPFRAEIEGLDASALERATEAAERRSNRGMAETRPCLHT